MVRILRNEKLAFEAALQSIEEVKAIFNSLKEKDKEYGKFNYQIEGLKELIQNQLLHLQKQRVKNIYSQYGYLNLADIQYYASQNDQEAKALISWYQAYDDAIWDYIDNDLQAITDLEQLLNLKLETIEEELFKNSTKTAPLP